MEDKPSGLGDYERWLAKKFGISAADLSKHKSLYDNVSVVIKDRFEHSDFWTRLTELLREWNDEYFTITGYQLLAESRPELVVKSYDSFFLKTFRKNVLENKEWPEAPKGEWYLPDNWTIRVKDVVRTLLVVKYLDGVDFIVNKIRQLSTEVEQCGESECSFEAREHGYYAAHLGIPFQTELLNANLQNQKVVLNIELQVTTQLQDVIRKLTHKFYEGRRQEDSPPEPIERAWQWNYRSAEFVPNYLGHLLHFVEGMIMEVRDKGEMHLDG